MTESIEEMTASVSKEIEVIFKTLTLQNQYKLLDCAEALKKVQMATGWQQKDRKRAI